jgi:hypothetical protein
MQVCVLSDTPTDTESRPEGAGRVVKIEPNEPIGSRLTLESGAVLTVGPPGTRTVGLPGTRSSLAQTANGQDSLAVYGHDGSGLWVLWVGLDPSRGPDCYALPMIGYDRPGYIGWPGDGFALPKGDGLPCRGRGVPRSRPAVGHVRLVHERRFRGWFGDVLHLIARGGQFGLARVWGASAFGKRALTT